MSISLQMLDNSKMSILLLLFGFFSILPVNVSGQSSYDSLLNLIPGTDKRELPSLYMELFASSLDSVELAIEYAQLSRELSLEIGDSLGYVRAEYAIGHVYRITGDYNNAIKRFKSSAFTARNNNYETREMRALNGLGLAYYTMSKWDSALRFHFESLKLREKIGDPYDISIATNNLGLVYYQLNDYNKAKLYFERTLAIDEENNLISDDGTYVNLGLANYGLSRYDEAIKYFTKTIENCYNNCDPRTLTQAYDSRGITYLSKNKDNTNQEDYEAAKSDYLNALRIAKENGIETSLPSIYSGLAKYYIQSGDLSNAEIYLDSSQRFAEELAVPRDLKTNYQYFAEISSQRKDFESAYKYQLLYDSVSKAVLDEVIAKNLLQIQVDFEERENLEIIALKNQEIDRATTFLLLATIIALLTALIVVLLYRNNISRKKVNKRLYIANETIEEQNKKLTDLNTVLEERVKERTEELRKSNAALIKSNHELDNFIYKTSHDIRGPLATLQGVCNIALMDISDPMAVDYFQKLSKTAVKLNRILSKLLIINQINNSTPTNEDVNVAELVGDLVDENSIGYLNKEINIELQMSKLKWRGDKDLLKIIMSNLIDNSFKFHDPNMSVDSFIKIEGGKKNGTLEMRVSDNGLGIDEGIAHEIFDIFSKTSEINDSAGMGLYLAKLAVDKMNGDISIEKSINGLTVFKIRLPELTLVS